MDSMRARNTSLHGYPRETTPFMESLADRATIYEQARSPGIHSIASHASMFSGYHVHEHRMVDAKSRLADGHTIWERLADDHGYATGLFTANYVLTHTSNLHTFFDTVVSYEADFEPLFGDGISPAEFDALSYRAYLRACLQSDAPAKSLANGVWFKYQSIYQQRRGYYEKQTDQPYIDAFLDWQAGRDDWAACLNMYTPHYPYRPDPEFDRWGDETLEGLYESLDTNSPMTTTFLSGERPWWHLEAFEHRYDGAIRQTDAIVEQLFERLRSAGVFEDTLVVLTSDHGEGFGERSVLDPSVRFVDHNYGIDEVLTHVPLIVSYPGQQSGERVDDLATLRRFPAVVEATLDGAPDRDAFVPDGPVLTSTFKVQAPEESLPESCPNRAAFGGPWHAVYERDGDDIRKYVRRRDDAATVVVPNSQVSYRVADTDSGVVDDTLTALDPVDDPKSDTRDLAGDTENRLRELGYLS